MIEYYLGFYQGQLWSDIFGNLVFAIPVFLWARARDKALHLKLDKQQQHINQLTDDLNQQDGG